MVSVLNSIGYGVHLLEKEKCCGVALISNGLINQARRQADLNIRSIRKSVFEDKRPVIGASSTCIFTMRDEYPHLLGIENSDVRDNIELATRFIYRLIEEGKVKLKFRDDVKMKIAYHTPRVIWKSSDGLIIPFHYCVRYQTLILCLTLNAGE